MLKRIFVITGIILAFAALFIFNKLTTKKNNDIVPVFAEAKRGLFEIAVTTSGELIAEKSIEIRGPEMEQSGNNSRQGSQSRGGEMRATDIKIQDLVPEGTIVKAGDYIAQLDRTSYSNTLNDAYSSLRTEQNTLEMKIIDTAVTLTSLRDAMKNQKYVVEEAEIELEQDKFEPPAIIRKAAEGLNQTRRSLELEKQAYELRVAQILADLTYQKLRVQNASDLITNLQDFLSKFRITSPSDGMIIYKRDRDGTKRKSGSSLNPFDLVIATLPDLTSMISKTYVNEIDESKIRHGQKVNITIDAFAEKVFSGQVITIGNIGEVLPNSDSKMFEVHIKVDGYNPDLRPSMTTGNKIIIKTFNDVIFIPTECVETGPDSIPYVYRKNKTRQIVVPGEANDKYVIIKKGLKEGTSVYLSPPENFKSYRLKGQELIPEIKKTYY
jgi:multidrug efflux pump subunit AcrA (membrane-fusion protein)